jgi:uncharacterized damage-inducible protein DinB
VETALEFIRDLYGHQEWADAEHWKAIEAHPGAIDDDGICKRLRHLHTTQHAYLLLVRGDQVDLRSFAKRYGDSVAMQAVKGHAVEVHRETAKLLSELPASRLEEKILIPWFKDPAFNVTIGQALAQAAMHSQYHRGQNATRLRELGGKPPTTDFVLWILKGRPKGEWVMLDELRKGT